jgi:preprotein translocase SecE subunit
MTEVKRIRWPKMDELVKNSTTVIMVTVVFGVFFVLVQAVVTLFLRLIGV